MQDNARPHVAGVSQQFLQDEGIEAMDWPACSPDLNPIEHIWDIMSRTIHQFPPDSPVSTPHVSGLSLLLLLVIQNQPPSGFPLRDQDGRFFTNSSRFLLLDTRSIDGNGSLRVKVNTKQSEVSHTSVTPADLLSVRVELPLVLLIGAGSALIAGILLVNILVCCLVLKKKRIRYHMGNQLTLRFFKVAIFCFDDCFAHSWHSLDELQEVVTRNGFHFTVAKTIKRYKETGSHEDRPRKGRPRVTSASEDKFIRVTSLRNHRLTAAQIRDQVNATQSSSSRHISTTTVKRRLCAAGLHGKIAARKPLLRTGNKQKRLVWAEEHKEWTLDQWKSVLWFDESKFEIFGSNNRVFMRRRKGEWMDSTCLVPTDNDPKHTSRLCKGYLTKKESDGVLHQMTWPLQSPDLNPIEMVWGELDHRVKAKGPTSAKHLWELLQDCWKTISGDYLLKLIKRMQRVCKAVIKAKGGYFEEPRI
ncbi:unnamed protein product [Ranitomeya imitator]|uniref:Transposase n=1 Tax=Ranitomeya imitator TaxID=111125 RepID=A0ABN9LVK0_9NEOB|nr:unnamed protein product [Ranitomeya imitator]